MSNAIKNTKNQNVRILTLPTQNPIAMKNKIKLDQFILELQSQLAGKIFGGAECEICVDADNNVCDESEAASKIKVVVKVSPSKPE